MRQAATFLATLVVWLAGCSGSAPLPPQAVALNRAGAEALARGDLETADARFNLALEYSPRFVEALVNQGLVELQRGNFDRARELVVRARRLNPDVAQPHHALGVLAARRPTKPRFTTTTRWPSIPDLRRLAPTSRACCSTAACSRRRSYSSSAWSRWRPTPRRPRKAWPRRCYVSVEWTKRRRSRAPPASASPTRRSWWCSPRVASCGGATWRAPSSFCHRSATGATT